MTKTEDTERAVTPEADHAEAPTAPTRLDPVTIVTSASLAALFASLVSGLLLAMIGLHHAYLQAPLALIIGGALYRFMPRRSASDRPGGVTAVLLLVVVGVTLINAGSRSELLLTSRDGATYANTGSFLVEGSGLFPTAVEEPFIGADLGFGAPGFELRSDGTFWQQFLHATPTLYGFVGELLGKSAMFLVNAVVSGIGVLAMFCLASRFMSAWWAVLASALTAASLPYMYFARGTFSEMSSLALTMGGLWLAHLAMTETQRYALPAGLLLGGTVVVRVDSWMIGISIGLLLATTLWFGEKRETATAEWLYIGFSFGAVLSMIDMGVFSQPYLVHHASLLIMVAGAAVVARLIAPVAGAGSVQRLFPGYLRNLGRIKLATTAVLIGSMTYLWLIRPFVTQGIGGGYDLAGIQARQGLAIDPTRSYAELSVHWTVWYVGIPIVLLGFIGVVVVARRSLEPGTAAHRMIFFAFLVPAATYFIRPSINPDQIWAIRRFLPVVIPILVMYAMATLERFVGRIPNRRVAGPVAAVLVLAAGLPLLVTSSPLVFDSDHADMEDQILSLCEKLGDSESVLILDNDPDLPLSWMLGPPLRSWCHVSVAATPAGSTYEVAPDVVVAAESRLLPSPPERSHEFTAEAWERTLIGAPSGTASGRLEIWIDEG